MIINSLQSIIAFGVSAIIAYGFYNFHNGENKLLVGISSFVFLATTLFVAIAIKYELPRTTINVKTLSGLFFIISLFTNLFFIFLYFSVPSYLIINGILFLAFIFLVYSINGVGQ